MEEKIKNNIKVFMSALNLYQSIFEVTEKKLTLRHFFSLLKYK